jgi:3-hydroxybutyryl-CoA dehydrogenase
VRVAVIGAGLMGAGVAQVFAAAGFDVALGARSRESLDAARDRIGRSQRDLVRAGLLTEPEAGASLGRVRFTQDLAEAVGAADFVSENIPEDLGIKQALFQRLSQLATPAAILSTNTSGLPITAIAAVADRPERVVGFHWLNPPHLTVPVEITRGAKTSEATMQAAVAVAERLGRRPLRVERDTPGFLWNRLQMALLREALDLVEQGIATADTVDQAIQLGLGLRWAAIGPFRIVDLAGLPTFRAVAAHVYPVLSNAVAPQALLEDSIRRGRTGARAGHGFYDYPPGAHEALIRERDDRLIALRRLLAEGDSPSRGPR